MSLSHLLQRPDPGRQAEIDKRMYPVQLPTMGVGGRTVCRSNVINPANYGPGFATA